MRLYMPVTGQLIPAWACKHVNITLDHVEVENAQEYAPEALLHMFIVNAVKHMTEEEKRRLSQLNPLKVLDFVEVLPLFARFIMLAELQPWYLAYQQHPHSLEHSRRLLRARRGRLHESQSNA